MDYQDVSSAGVVEPDRASRRVAGAVQANSAPTKELRLEVPEITRLLLAVIVVLTVGGFGIRVMGMAFDIPPARFYIRMFSLSGENNVPTWYQVVMLALCSVILLGIGRAVWGQGTRQAAFYWYLLGGIFAYLSADEMIQIHELAVEPMRSALGVEGGILYFAWVIPATAIVAVLGVFMIPFLRGLPRRTMIQFVVAGAVFVLGAIGIEMVSAPFYTPYSNDQSLLYLALAYLEEFAEMLGVVLFLRALLDHVGRMFASVRFAPAAGIWRV